MIRQAIKRAAESLGFQIVRVKHGRDIPDAAMYRPLFCPWMTESAQHDYRVAAANTLVTPDRCYVLATLLRQAESVEGDVWECGVYRGGTAAMMASLTRKKLYLFDTFEGMPETDAKRDLHSAGDFADTSAESVAALVGHGVLMRKGFIPDTFSGLEDSKIAFAHIDVDLYKSVLDSIRFIWPRVSRGGLVVFDDYGWPACPGARRAVDEFFSATGTFPLALSTGQAVVFKG